MIVESLIFLGFRVIQLLYYAGRFTGRLSSQLSYTPMSNFSLFALNELIIQQTQSFVKYHFNKFPTKFSVPLEKRTHRATAFT